MCDNKTELLFGKVLTHIEQMFIMQTEQMFRDVLSFKKTVNDMKENRRHHYKIVKPVRFFIFVVISIMIIVFAGAGMFVGLVGSFTSIRKYMNV